MDKETARAFGRMSEKMNELGQRIDNLTNKRIDDITPYTDTKTVYIGDTEVTFYDVPSGNVTVYFDKPYELKRIADRVELSFDSLDDIKEITISVI